MNASTSAWCPPIVPATLQAPPERTKASVNWPSPVFVRRSERLVMASLPPQVQVGKYGASSVVPLGPSPSRGTTVASFGPPSLPGRPPEPPAPVDPPDPPPVVVLEAVV